jgi:hypothetical protein
MNEKKIALITVNFFCSDLIGYQLHATFSFNDPKDILFIIVDNSNDIKEHKRLMDKIRIYEKLNSTIIVKNISLNTPRGENGASLSHASGLDIGLSLARLLGVQILITLDPDCFVLQSYKNILSNYDSYPIFGTPYDLIKQSKISGIENFPCAFLMFIKMDKIPDLISFRPIGFANEIAETGHDTGYQFREVMGKGPFAAFTIASDNEKLFHKSKGFIPQRGTLYHDKFGSPVAFHIGKFSRRAPLKINQYFKGGIFKYLNLVNLNIILHNIRTDIKIRQYVKFFQSYVKFVE